LQDEARRINLFPAHLAAADTLASLTARLHRLVHQLPQVGFGRTGDDVTAGMSRITR